MIRIIFGALALLCCAGLGIEAALYGVPAAAAQSICASPPKNGLCPLANAQVQVPAPKPPVPPMYAPKCRPDVRHEKGGWIAWWPDSCAASDVASQIEIQMGETP